VRGPGIARVMVPGHLLIVIVWEREEKLSSGSKGRRRKHVHVDEPLALVLTPPTCQALFWAAGVLLGRSSEVLERGGLGINGNEELEFDLELPGVTYPPCGN
jgi:hypothetical protein